MTRLVDRLIGREAREDTQKYVTEAHEFFVHRNGLQVLEGLLVPDGVAVQRFDGGFQYGIGQGMVRVRAYADRGIMQGQIECAGQPTRQLIGGVISERSKTLQRVTFVNPDDRLVGFSGVEMSRSADGEVDIKPFNTYGPARSPRIIDLTRARLLALRQNGRVGVPARRS